MSMQLVKRFINLIIIVVSLLSGAYFLGLFDSFRSAYTGATKAIHTKSSETEAVTNNNNVAKFNLLPKSTELSNLTFKYDPEVGNSYIPTLKKHCDFFRTIDLRQCVIKLNKFKQNEFKRLSSQKSYIKIFEYVAKTLFNKHTLLSENLQYRALDHITELDQLATSYQVNSFMFIDRLKEIEAFLDNVITLEQFSDNQLNSIALKNQQEPRELLSFSDLNLAQTYRAYIYYYLATSSQNVAFETLKLYDRVNLDSQHLERIQANRDYLDQWLLEYYAFIIDNDPFSATLNDDFAIIAYLHNKVKLANILLRLKLSQIITKYDLTEIGKQIVAVNQQIILPSRSEFFYIELEQLLRDFESCFTLETLGA